MQRCWHTKRVWISSEYTNKCWHRTAKIQVVNSPIRNAPADIEITLRNRRLLFWEINTDLVL